MSNSEVLAVASKIAMMNNIYGVTMGNEAVMYQAQLLGELDFDAVMNAFDQYAKTNKTNRPATPAHIRELACPGVSDDTKAQHITGLVLKAVTKCGWQQQQQACEMIGPVGWAIVERYGWEYICENLGVDLSVSTFTAQLREGVKAELQISAAGRSNDSNLLKYNQPKNLPQAGNGMNSAGDIMKTIMPKEAK